MLSVVATLPVSEGGLGGGVVYIDTESSFSPERYTVELLSIQKEMKH